MIVLSIIGIALLGFLLIYSMILFNRHCNSKFGYAFFNRKAFIAIALAVIMLFVGFEWYNKSVIDNGDTWNGLILMGIAVLVLLACIYFNFKRTSLLYGVGGSILQLSIFGILGYISVFLLIGYFILSILLSVGAQRVYY